MWQLHGRTSAKRLALAVGGVVCLWMAPIAAYQDGIVADHCVHCHEAPLQAELTLTSEAEEMSPGEPAWFVAELRGEGLMVGGVSIQFEGTGELIAPDTGELQLLSGQLTHSAPVPAVDGMVAFRFGYLPPDMPGDVRFNITALAADGDGTALGDIASEGLYGFAFGCDSQTFYVDGDGDAYGSASTSGLVACANSPPEGYVSAAGDCNDYSSASHPAAEESCNGVDDDCNDLVDDAPPGESLCATGEMCRAGACAPSDETDKRSGGCSFSPQGNDPPWMLGSPLGLLLFVRRRQGALQERVDTARPTPPPAGAPSRTTFQRRT